MAEKNKDVGSPESMNTRWWESYLVRYFIGFIVGAGCVATIVGQFVSAQFLGSLVSVSNGKPDWSVIFWMLALGGLGYCYIASTPITVLHAGRYGRGAIDSQSRHFWLSWVIVLLVSSIPGFTVNCFIYPALGGPLLVILVALLIYLGKSAKEEKNQCLTKKCVFIYSTGIWCLMLLIVALVINSFLAIKTPSWILPLLILGFPIVWIGFAQYAVLWRLLFEQKEVEEFYKRLFHARRQPNARDVRDTYTHLREHSNSVFIVLVELCLLALVFSLVRISSSSGHPPDLGVFFQILGVGVAVWVLPTVFMWSRANAMENSFSADPAGFLGLSVDNNPPSNQGAAQNDVSVERKPL